MVKRRWSALFLVFFAVSAPAVFAADGRPIARVGDTTVSAEELSRRLARIPDFQRAALADTPEKLERKVLETMIVPDLLYAAEAERLKLADRPALRDRRREILRQAMERELRIESGRDAPVTNADVKAYFTANQARFETPPRIRIWRILLDDEALARKIIADCQGVDGLKRWSQYARENSLDKATQLRDGDLGFVHPDGNTDAPTLRVDPALFVAANSLADGELSKQPLNEGALWAVIWRRGSAPAISRTVAQEEGSIRQVLTRERVEKARQKLVAELRAKYVSSTNEALLDTVRFDVEGVPARPTQVHEAHVPAAGSSVPTATERGTR